MWPRLTLRQLTVSLSSRSMALDRGQVVVGIFPNGSPPGQNKICGASRDGLWPDDTEPPAIREGNRTLDGFRPD